MASAYHVPSSAGGWNYLIDKPLDVRVVGHFKKLGDLNSNSHALDVRDDHFKNSRGGHHIVIVEENIIRAIFYVTVAPLQNMPDLQGNPILGFCLFETEKLATTNVAFAHQVFTSNNSRGKGFATKAMEIGARLAQNEGAVAIFGQSNNVDSKRWPMVAKALGLEDRLRRWPGTAWVGLRLI